MTQESLDKTLGFVRHILTFVGGYLVTSGFLTEFWNQGGLRGDTPDQAYFVKCDDETNTLASIDNGEVRLEIGVALQRPAEFVVIKIGQFDGGTTVTVE